MGSINLSISSFKKPSIFILRYLLWKLNRATRPHILEFAAAYNSKYQKARNCYGCRHKKYTTMSDRFQYNASSPVHITSARLPKRGCRRDAGFLVCRVVRQPLQNRIHPQLVLIHCHRAVNYVHVLDDPIWTQMGSKFVCSVRMVCLVKVA